MAERVKVFNDTKFNIGLKDTRGVEYNIKPGAFGLFDKQDVEYFATIARKLFDQPHRLRIEDAEVAAGCGVATEGDDPCDPAVIRKRLQGSLGKVQTYIDSIEDGYLLDLVCDVALQMDLSNSKMALLREKCPGRFQDGA